MSSFASVLTQPVAVESFVWALESVAREFGLPFEHDHSARFLALPLSLCEAHESFLGMGLSVGVVQGLIDGFAADDGVWIALFREVRDQGTEPFGTDCAGAPWSLVRVQADNGGFQILGCRWPVPVTMAASDFMSRYGGFSVRVVKPVEDTFPGESGDPPGPSFGWRRFAKELMRYRSAWRDVIVASIVIQFIALAIPLLTQVIVDKVLVHRTESTLLVIACALVLATLTSSVLAWLRQHLVLQAGSRVDAVLASDVFSHLLHLPPRYFERRPTGVLVARLNGVEVVREFVTGAALTLLLDVPFMLVFGVVMVIYSPVLAAIAFAALVAIIAVSVAGTPGLRRRLDDQFLAGAHHQAFVTERLAAIETVKSLQIEPGSVRRFEVLHAKFLEAAVRTRSLANLLGVSAQTLEQLLSLSVLCVGAWLVLQDGALTVGGLIACQMFASRMTGPASRIASLWREFQQVHVAIRRLADIMDMPSEPQRVVGATSTPRVGRLDCDELGFRYGDQPALFRGLTFALEPGQCAAVIGDSGSGKSTLVRLLQGFYLPTEGRIRLDGVDSMRLAANEIRGYFGVVPQETRLFAGTVLDNLREVALGASFEDVASACRIAGLHSAICAMPNGYMYRLGENGTGLSGGQKQRLAIARALLKGARILVFDEATSSLDPSLAGTLVETINAMRGSVSVLFVAHWLPERLNADVVVRIGTLRGEAP